MVSTVRDICKFIGGAVVGPPVCVETGCTYVCAEGDEKHTTTNNLYEHVCKGRFGYLFSFDVDAVHIEFAKGLLPKNN